jgi:hypothetical protein
MASETQIDVILKQIRDSIATRRSEGQYPLGLEQQLEQEFAAIISSTNRRHFVNNHLLAQLDTLELAFSQLSGVTPTKSRIPGGTLFHRVTRFLTKRQVAGLAEQVRNVQIHSIAALRTLAEFAQSQEDADARLVRELYQHVMDRVAVIDHLVILHQEIEERLRSLESPSG